MKRIKTRLGATVIVALVLAAGIGWWLLHPRQDNAANAAIPSPAVATSMVQNGVFVERVAAHGRVGPPAGSDAKLAFAGSGILTSIDVQVGQRIVAGQRLAEYGGAAVAAAQLASARAKIAAMQSKLASLEAGRGTVQSDEANARSALRQSEAKVALDQSALSREQKLYVAGIAARKDVEAAQSQLTLDLADLHANQSRLSTASAGVGDAITQARADLQASISEAAVAQRNLENATLRAPADGVVVGVLKHVGEAVDPATPVIDVGPALAHIVTLTIPGADGRRVRVGDTVDYSVAARGITAHGHVKGVVPNVDPTTQTTTVTVDGAPPSVAEGDAVDAGITVGRSSGVVIPASAVVQDPQTGETMAFVQTHRPNGTTQFVEHAVTLGPSNDRVALVRSGLHPGERIATQGSFDLLVGS